MKIYVDTCALNRLVDQSEAPRILAEREAMLRILEVIDSGGFTWVSSNVLGLEVSQTPDRVRREELLQLLAKAEYKVIATIELAERAALFEPHGLGAMDAMHLAVAEHIDASYLVTTDDKFMKAAQRIKPAVRTELINPVDLVQRRLLWLVPKPY